MAQLGDDLQKLHEQIAHGALPRAYGSIVGYMAQLRSHFAARDGDRAVSALYQGCFDMTYFALHPAALKSRGLKLAIVFDYEAFGFEVWLAARNRAVQRQYWQLLQDNGWTAHRLVEPAPGIDAIVETDVAGASAMNEPEALTASIEESAQVLLAEVLAFLDAHDPREQR